MNSITEILPSEGVEALASDLLEEPFAFSMAYQPIVDVTTGTVYAYEALVRGPLGEDAQTVLQKVTAENRYRFDQGSRRKAIALAAELGLASSEARLSINFMPGAPYSAAACIQMTIDTAASLGFPLWKLIFEITETEQVRDRARLREVVSEYRRLGLKVALDDFGAAHNGFNLLADFPTDLIKLDIELARDLPLRPTAIAIVKTMVRLAKELDNELVAEGVETLEEYDALRECGVRLMQGYLFARPGFESLPDMVMPR